MNRPVAVILAAGKGTRMKSDLPKVVHEVCGRSMVEYVLDTAREAGAERLIVVVGHGADIVKQAIRSSANSSDVEFALQSEQKGTGHAVMMCEPLLKGHDGPVIVLAGDTPLLRAGSLSSLLEEQQRTGAACVIGTAVTEANKGLGRIVRDAGGNFQRIVEEKDATPEEARIREINTGCFAFDCRSLLWALTRIRPDNKQAEYYLTDCPAILLSEGKTVIAVDRLTITEALGVNTRVQLADAARAIQKTTMERFMLDGVTIAAPESTYIDPRAQIGAGTVILPFTSIDGPSVIGRDCRLGSHAHVEAGAHLPDNTVLAPFQTAAGK